MNLILPFLMEDIEVLEYHQHVLTGQVLVDEAESEGVDLVDQVLLGDVDYGQSGHHRLELDSLPR